MQVSLGKQVSYFRLVCAEDCQYFHLRVSEAIAAASTMSRYPYLAFGKVKVEEKEDGLTGEESLDIVRDQLLPNIDHLIVTNQTKYWQPCSIADFLFVLRIHQSAHRPFRNLQLVF